MSGRVLSTTLIVIASLIAIASVLTTWVDRQMLDDEAWKEASAELIEDPAVREALSVHLVDELYDNVDVRAELEQRLPPDLDGLAGPAAGALRSVATDAVNRVLDAPRVEQLWIDASSLAQQKLVNVLEDETGQGISTGDGVVTLELGELLTQVGQELGLSTAALDRIPPDSGVITVMRSSELAEAQAGVRALRVLSGVLLVLVLALYALAVYLAGRDERRRTLRNVGWALVLVGLAVLVARRFAGQYAVDALTAPPSRDAGERTWLIGSSILGQIGVAAVLYGVVVVLGAVLAGPTARAAAVRGRIAVALHGGTGPAWAVAGGAYLLLVLWGPTEALRTAWGIALLGALVAAGLVALLRQITRQDPDTARDDPPAPPAARVTQAGPVARAVGAGGEAPSRRAT